MHSWVSCGILKKFLESTSEFKAKGGFLYLSGRSIRIGQIFEQLEYTWKFKVTSAIPTFACIASASYHCVVVMIFIVLSDVCRVFVLLTALGQKSLTGQSASEVIESILMLLGKLLSPLLAVSQQPMDVYYRSASSQYILQPLWCLLVTCQHMVAWGCDVYFYLNTW